MYMSLQTNFCTYTSDYKSCMWQSINPGSGDINSGYMTTPPACPSDQTGVSSYMGNCPGYALCDNGYYSGGGAEGNDDSGSSGTSSSIPGTHDKTEDDVDDE